jgi:hypothetical protein
MLLSPGTEIEPRSGPDCAKDVGEVIARLLTARFAYGKARFDCRDVFPALLILGKVKGSWRSLNGAQNGRARNVE